MKLNRMIEKSDEYRKFLSNGLYLFIKDLHLNHKKFIWFNNDFLCKFRIIEYSYLNIFKDYIIESEEYKWN